MKTLFICNQNQNRSKTAEIIFKNIFQTRSAGLYNGRPVTEKDIFWADIIFVMEEDQRMELVKRFPYQCLQKRILCLNIPDFYHFNQPELIDLLKLKINQILL